MGARPAAKQPARAARERLGIYVDDVYRVSPLDGARRVSVDRAFLLFACEVGRRVGTTVLFGRAKESPDPSDYVLPTDVSLVELPHYDNLRRLGQVVRATVGTVTGMWRGLDRVDTVWVFGPHPFALPLIAFAAARRKRIVLGVRQQTLAYHRSRLPGPLWKPALAVVWLSEVVYRLLSRRVETTVVGPDIAARYNGSGHLLTMTVSLVRAEDVVEAAPERDWSGEITLLTVGRLEPEKNPLLLLEALARLERETPGRYRLVWVGRGDLEQEVRQHADELGIGDRVELPGYVPFGPRLLDRYRSAHALVHVSRTEGVPQVLIEACAAGTPVVATDVGGVRATLAGGEAGLLVPPDDADALVAAIRRLSEDAGLRRAIAERGLAVARGATFEAEAEQVARFIAADGTPAGSPAAAHG